MSEKLLKASVLGGHPPFHVFLPSGTKVKIRDSLHGEESKRPRLGSGRRRGREIFEILIEHSP